MGKPIVTRLILTLDSSTHAAKAALWTAGGVPVAEASCPHRIVAPDADRREQDAEEWWIAASTALRQAVRERSGAPIACLSVSWQRETFVLTDADDRPVMPAILWMDRRARAEVERLVADGIADDYHRRTGKPLDPTGALPRLMWINRHCDGGVGRARFHDVCSFLSSRLCGVAATCPVGADTTGLIDLRDGDWIAPYVEQGGLDLDRMPALVPPGGLLGEVTPEATRATGLPAGLPVVAGGGDGHMFVEGARGASDRCATLNLGTSVVVSRPLTEPVLSPSFRTLVSARPGQWLAEAVMHSGTRVLNWFVERMAPQGGEHSAGHADRRAGQIAPGSDGLVTVPYWNGVRVPYNDPFARGITIGWTEEHTPSHFYRSLLEGIAFETRLLCEELDHDTGDCGVDAVHLGGGGARSALWAEILAAVHGRPMVVPHHVEATSRGAAMQGAVYAGIHASWPDARAAMSGPVARVDPGPHRELYDRLYRGVYRPLYPALREMMRHGVDIVRGENVP